MKMLIALLALMSMSAFADELYSCVDIQKVNGRMDEERLEVKTSFFTGKVKSYGMITKALEAKDFVAVENPFVHADAEYYKLDQAEVALTKKLKFFELSGRNVKFRMSESLKNLEETGYFHYHNAYCNWKCSVFSYYFKCTKI